MLLEVLKKEKHHKKIVACLVFICAFTVYLITLAPTVSLEDSAEFVTSAAILGIAHPSGYPLYSLLGNVFIKLIPFAEIAWRVNLMSAFFGALTCAFLSLIVDQLFTVLGQTKKNIIYPFLNLAVCATLAYSFTFWSQSVVAEVYTLNCFFVALLIWLLLRWTASRARDHYLYLFAFFYGLSLTNHTMLALLAPAFLLYIALVGGRPLFTRYRALLLCFLLFTVGLAVYLYLPIRSLANPALDWGNPETWSAISAHISRAQYGDIGIIGAGSKLVLLESFFVNSAKEFSWPLIVFALAGLVYLTVRQWRLGILLFAIFLSAGPGIILLRTFGWGIGIERIYAVYYLPCYLVLMVGLAAALFYVFNRIGSLSHFPPRLKNIVVALALALLFTVPFGLMARNFADNCERRFYLTANWARQTLASLEPNAILISKNDGVTGDAQSFTLAYTHIVEKLRPDVMIVDDGGVFYQPAGWHLPPTYFSLSFMDQQQAITEYFAAYARLNQRPLYTTFPIDTQDLTHYSNGIVYRVFEARHSPPPLQANIILDLTKENMANYSQVANDFLASYYYALAAYLLEHDNQHYSQYFLTAIALDEEPFSAEYQGFVAHRAQLAGR